MEDFAAAGVTEEEKAEKKMERLHKGRFGSRGSDRRREGRKEDGETA